MDIAKVVDKIQELLDEYFPSVPFDVRTPNLPKINKVTGGYPIMVSGGMGEYEAYPSILLNSPAYQVQILVPANVLESATIAHDVLAEKMVGKALSFGEDNDTEIALCNMSSMEVGQLGLLDANTFGELNETVNRLFDRTVKDLRYWILCNFSVFLTIAKNAGGVTENDNGVVFGNQFTNTISFSHNGHTYQETYVNINTNHSMASSPYEQQSVESKYQKGVEQASAYTKSVNMFFRYNSFFTELAGLYKDKAYQGVRFSFTSKITFANGNELIVEQDTDLMCSNMEFSVVPGELLMISLSLEPSIEVEASA